MVGEHGLAAREVLGSHLTEPRDGGLVDAGPAPALEVVERETADVDRAGHEDVANEDESERRLSIGELFAEVLEMKCGRCRQLLVSVRVKGSELVFRRRRTDVLAGLLFSQCERLSYTTAN